MCFAHFKQHSLFLLLCLSNLNLFAADVPATNNDTSPIVGAGAHFSWVIFNDLKPALEHRSGRAVTLYGKESMLGMGCNAGIKMAQQNRPGNETFGFICCSLDEKEIEDKDIRVHPIAKEPILILVNKKNQVKNLSRTQVRDIFSGKITNWQEVGGADKPIVVVTRLHCKHRPGHWKRILPNAKAFRKERLNVKSAAEMVKAVSDFPGAIGHTGATWEFGHESKSMSIHIDGKAPTAENLSAGQYPFYRVLSAVTNRQASPAVMSIIRQVQNGSEFDSVARKYQLVPLRQ